MVSHVFKILKRKRCFESARSHVLFGVTHLLKMKKIFFTSDSASLLLFDLSSHASRQQSRVHLLFLLCLLPHQDASVFWAVENGIILCYSKLQSEKVSLLNSVCFVGSSALSYVPSVTWMTPFHECPTTKTALSQVSVRSLMMP